MWEFSKTRQTPVTTPRDIVLEHYLKIGVVFFANAPKIDRLFWGYFDPADYYFDSRVNRHVQVTLALRIDLSITEGKTDKIL